MLLYQALTSEHWYVGDIYNHVRQADIIAAGVTDPNLVYRGQYKVYPAPASDW